MNIRPLCKACNKNLAAANYWRDDVRHYRSKCENCIRKKRGLPNTDPRWKKSGYKKKAQCDLCSFRAKYASQIVVYHIDGNLNNSDLINLRSVCLNCMESVKRNMTTWKVGDIQID